MNLDEFVPNRTARWWGWCFLETLNAFKEWLTLGVELTGGLIRNLMYFSTNARKISGTRWKSGRRRRWKGGSLLLLLTWNISCQYCQQEDEDQFHTRATRNPIEKKIEWKKWRMKCPLNVLMIPITAMFSKKEGWGFDGTASAQVWRWLHDD